MAQKDKTKEGLIKDIKLLKKRIAELETVDTESKKAEEALQQSEGNFKGIVENANDGMLIGTGEEGWHVYANRRAVEITGYSIEELLKTRIRDLVHPDEFPKLIERYKKRLAGLEVPKPYETILVNKEGIKVPIEISPSRTIWQNQLADMVVFRDITKRKQEEEALRASEAKYRLLAENLPQKIFIKDRNLVYIFCNKIYARDLKVEAEEIKGKTDYDFYPKELAEKYRADDKRIMESGKIEDIEEKYIQDGQEGFVHIVKAPVMDEQGNAIGILGVFWDITETKKMEEEARKRLQELEVFYKASMGREERIIELKKEIEMLKKELEANRKTL